MEFCLQSSRALPFQQEVIPGASPLSLHQNPVEGPLRHAQGEPKLDSNLLCGIPPPEILEKCEFLEPLSQQAMEDYKWLISSMEKPHDGHFSRINRFLRQKLLGG
ncbi:hypothetical protein HPP92_014662 [Vanilla planifolia]|uniref:Uncharacterized protein n=1 Tax=Vanilla planifolia TaxID=51239 RepID=A0A835QPY0_VANPL|nr:hypothetical protein HPP92_014662 [Vanilla planifolia]